MSTKFNHSRCKEVRPVGGVALSSGYATEPVHEGLEAMTIWPDNECQSARLWALREVGN